MKVAYKSSDGDGVGMFQVHIGAKTHSGVQPSGNGKL